MISQTQEQLKSGMLKERIWVNNITIIATVLLLLSECALITFALLTQLYFLFIFAGVILLVYVIGIPLANKQVKKMEEIREAEKLRNTVDNIVTKEEYELVVMDTDFAIKATKRGFIIDDELFGYDNFDIFLGSSNMYRQASLAIFVVSNYSPFSDDKTYPMNFGIVLDSEVLGCAKQYFFEDDYKAFNFILENPEQSAKEILKYGMLKIQIEERKKQKALDKLEKELSENE